MRLRIRELAQQSLSHAIDPSHPDYMAWSTGPQTLVDSAYLCYALLHAPDALWHPLDSITKSPLIKEITSTRKYELPYNIWLLFAALNEAWLLSIGQQPDILRLNTGLRKRKRAL